MNRGLSGAAARLLLLVGLLLMTPQIRGGELPPIVEMLSSKYYNPVVAGLQSLEVVVHNPRFERMLPGATIRAYWKAPGQKRVRIENPPARVAGQVAELEKQLVGLVDNIVPEGFLALARRRDVTVREDQTLTHVILAPRPGASESTSHYWFDKDLRMTRALSESLNSGRLERTDFDSITVSEQGAHFLVTEMKGTSPTGSAEIRWDYARVQEFWLPSRVIHVTGRKNVEETLFLDYKVNVSGGLSDELFRE